MGFDPVQQRVEQRLVGGLVPGGPAALREDFCFATPGNHMRPGANALDLAIDSTLKRCRPTDLRESEFYAGGASIQGEDSLRHQATPCVAEAV